MGIEIEHKFLVADESWKGNLQPTYIRQGYLSVQPTVRVRIYGDKGFLTIKGKPVGNVRAEYEYEIPVRDAADMLESLCPQPQIEKNRYKVHHEGHIWEIDVFFGANQGLVIAEVELSSPDEEFVLPVWVGKEVTEDISYTNAQLTIRPYSEWSTD